jgi:YD repeat-containing protein
VSKNDGKATTTYTYDGASGEHRGLVTSEDSSSGFGTSPSVFAAAYDTAGNLTTETYPSGLTATTTFDNTGYATGLVYARAGTTWLTFSQVSDSQGRTGAQSSPLSSQGVSSFLCKRWLILWFRGAG